jgi:ligand-binding sensor domain-containing protein
MKNLLQLILTSYLLLLLNHAYAQDIKFERISVEQGLSNNLVYCLYQDSRGFMWFGTDDGLNKYDGYKFTVYRHDPDDPSTLSHNRAYSICESLYDGKQVLWIGTWGGGLNELDLSTEQFTHYKHNPDNPNSLSDNVITKVYEDADGNLWVGTENSGLNRLNRKTGQFIRYTHNPNDPFSISSNKFNTICESRHDEKNVLWVGSWGGLNKFDPESGKFTRYMHDPDNLNSLSYNIINAMVADQSGVLWIATYNGGLNNYDPEKQQFTRYKHDASDLNSLSTNNISSICELRDSNKNVLWIGTQNGIHKFDRQTEQFTSYTHNPARPNSLSDNFVWSIFEDKGGVVWFASFKGVNKLDYRKQQFNLYQQDLSNSKYFSDNSIFAIHESRHENELWIGTKKGGFFKFNRQTGKYTPYRHDPGNPNSLSNNWVLTLIESQFGGKEELWIGTYSGLNKFDLKSKLFTRYPQDPMDSQGISLDITRSLCEDKSGNIWIGTENNGLYKFDREGERFIHCQYNLHELTNKPLTAIISIIQDKHNIIWIGTDADGMLKLDPENEQFTVYRNDPDLKNTISHNQVMSILESVHKGKDVLWIGTGGGLNRFDQETGQFKSYRKKDGLPSDAIYGILEDENKNLWLSTGNGILKFNPGTGEMHNYDRHDGLQSNQFSYGAYFKNRHGEMFFGGTNGFNSFFPDSIKDNPHMPKVVFTDFQLFNESAEIAFLCQYFP